MKTKHLFLSGTALVMAAALTFTGCRKEKTKDDDTSGAEDNSLADKSFDDMGQMSNEAASGGVSSFKSGNYDGMLSSGCGNLTLTFDTINHSDADSVTVDFGASNCLCMDGRYRRGKFYVMWSAGKKYWDSLASITHTTYPTNNFYVNDNQVIGTRHVTNKGHINGHMTWDVGVDGSPSSQYAQIVKANGQGTVTWQSTRTREWRAGESTPFIWADDEYGVTGSASGTSAKGTPFSMQITSQLIRKMSCPKHFVSGTFDFTPGSKPVRHVDFGYSPSPNPAGSCDSWISITINSTTYYKQLP